MSMERKERRAAAVSFLTASSLLEFDLEETSSDSDFIPADDQEADDFNSDDESNVDAGESSEEEEDDESDGDASLEEDGQDLTLDMLLGEPAAAKPDETINRGLAKHLKPICCACLGDRSDDANEVVECDGCGVTVHEACYGISESGSVSSTASSCSTEPWFCEACKAGIVNPPCELCPNVGGAYKETDCGRWVHLVCALYVPGVAFGDVEALTAVTLFEMQYNKWGAKACSLCDDARFARTGVCIGCDAGMCKTYFHVTCGQSAGFLAEAGFPDEVDPFFAHCKLHSDKTLVKNRKRNFQTWKLQSHQRTLEKQVKKAEGGPEQERIDRKLKKHKTKFLHNKSAKPDPWVPTQKMPRPLITSASICKRLMRKTELMGINAEALEIQEAQIAALSDVRKKWHIAPAFSVEFVGYFLDRTSRIEEMKRNLQEQKELNVTLTQQQESLRTQFEETVKQNELENNKLNNLKTAIETMHKKILEICPNKPLLTVDNLLNNQPATGNTVSVVKSPRRMAVPTAAALKMGVGFPLTNYDLNGRGCGRVLSTQSTESRASSTQDQLVHDCGICKGCNDQHLLAKCDTCLLYYHLGCLNPPLTRHPKKSKLYGWQCSECDKSDDSSPEIFPEKQPRRSRTRFSKDGRIVPVDTPVKLNGEISQETPSSPSFSPTHNKTPIVTPKKKFKPSESDEAKSPVSLKRKRSDSIIKQEQQSAVAGQNHVDIHHLEVKSPPSSPIQINSANVDDSKTYTSQIISGSPNQVNQVGEKLAKKLKRTESLTNGNGTDGVVRTKTKKKHKDKDKEKIRDKHKSSKNDGGGGGGECDNGVDSTVDGKERKSKRKRKRKYKYDEEPVASTNNVDQPRIKIKFKAIPPKPGGGGQGSAPVIFYLPSNEVNHFNIVHEPKEVESSVPKLASPIKVTSTPVIANKQPILTLNESNISDRSIGSNRSQQKKGETLQNACCMCAATGNTQNSVTCDECLKNYHFLCLDPPLKKTPKRRGYSWHCADCDPSDLESNK